MIDITMQSIRDNAVRYYNNENLVPEVTDKPSILSVTQYASYMYAITIKIFQDFGGFSYEESDKILTETAMKVFHKCNNPDIVKDYNGLFVFCIQRFWEGYEIGDNTIDGATMMVDNGSKIVGMSVAWIEQFNSKGLF